MNWPKHESSILETLDLGSNSCVALIGAGGKTTTLLALAEAAASARLRTLVTTTTKIWPPEGLPVVLASATEVAVDALQATFEDQRVVVLGEAIGPDGKLYGVTPEMVCGLYRERIADVILCEADGAAGRPLKSHGEGEPVIPGCSTLVLLVAGIDAVGRLVSSDSVHRLAEFCRATGAREGERIDPRDVATALVRAAEYAPPLARVVYVLNKIDGPVAVQAAEEVMIELRRLTPQPGVLLTRRGAVVSSFGIGASPAAGPSRWQ